MADDAAGHHRTRRRRATRAGRAAPAAPAAPEQGARAHPERALRDLVGGAPSQIGVDGALRARDVNRPTAEDLAEAERQVAIVRRHWRPDARG